MRTPAIGYFAILFLALLSASPLHAKTLGNPNAPKGGEITIGFPGYPKSLNSYVAFEELSLGVSMLVQETLLDADPDTNDPIPLLAKSWSISKDKKTFTFKIDPEARFADGKPVTADDVKFTWDVLLNPKNKTAPFRAMLSSFESCKTLDKMTVEFKAKDLHFKNLEKISGLFILPKHIYSKGDFNKSHNRTIAGSGPYTLLRADKGRQVVLKRNPKYWGAKLSQNIGKFNFDRVTFLSIPDYNVQFEAFKKGDIDFFYFLVSKMWVEDTKGPLFDRGYIKKLKVENSTPYGTQGVAWNMRRPLFQDKRVRLALSYLMNRKRWIDELFYNQYVPSTGPVAVNSEYHHPDNRPIPYDPKKAKDLLAQAGWTKVGNDGILVKDKQRFEFDMLASSPAADRYLTMYQEDLKKMGIKMNIRNVDWATMIRLIDDRQFDAVTSNRGRGIDPSDFAVSWGSEEADKKGSVNITGYKNPEIDKLARQIDETFDKKTRLPLVQKLDKIIGDDQPLSMAWEPTFYRIAYWDKFGMEGKGYHKYTNWKALFHYWWYDKAEAEKLKKAMAANKMLK
ncbi:MAG: ABC transporter substrate-binding protein [Bdellovibrionales bacterium]|nr:ABC transporter substrate-binding protein [Bdellovibrionales bacterium]